MTAWATVEELCDRHLGARPSPAALVQLKKAERERPQMRAFLERAFQLMELSRVRAVDIAPNQAWAIGNVISEFLPDAWGGSIPPYTWEHRHKRIDSYIASNPWFSAGPGTCFLEMGCGFPPKTAIDIARAHSDWRVIGADPCFDEYLLYDEEGDYACLSREGTVRYFHSRTGDTARFFALYRDKAATVRRFSELFAKISEKIAMSPDGGLAQVEEDGAKLIRHPIRNYEAANLTFVQLGIGAEFSPVDIIRCFSVLGYFDAQFRKDAESWALRTLRNGGLFLCGRDGERTTEAICSVYRREGGKLVHKEFALSIDNVRAFTVQPWFSIHENSAEAWTQAKLVGLLRADAEFRDAYDARYDAMLAAKRLFVRDSAGCLIAPPEQLPQTEWINAQEEILVELEREGFAERAAAVFRKSGLRSWVTRIGHVAVDPADLLPAERE